MLIRIQYRSFSTTLNIPTAMIILIIDMLRDWWI